MVELPTGKNVIGVKWIYKLKRNTNGSINRYKARLVAKWFLKTYGVDYSKSFTCMARLDIIRTIIALLVQHKLEIKQMDVKSTFFNGILWEEVYILKATTWVPYKG